MYLFRTISEKLDELSWLSSELFPELKNKNHVSHQTKRTSALTKKSSCNFQSVDEANESFKNDYQ